MRIQKSGPVVVTEVKAEGGQTAAYRAGIREYSRLSQRKF